MAIKILPLARCKHCGGEAEAHKYTGEVCFVKCKECGIQTPYLKPDEAIRRWNASAIGRKDYE